LKGVLRMQKILVSGGLKNGLKFDNTEVIIYKGKPKGEVPKTYKHIGVLSHNIGNNYNSSILTIYKAKNGYRYEIYRDGSFYPYYGKIEF